MDCRAKSGNDDKDWDDKDWCGQGPSTVARDRSSFDRICKTGMRQSRVTYLDAPQKSPDFRGVEKMIPGRPRLLTGGITVNISPLPPAAGSELLASAVWCSRQAMGSAGLAGSPVAAERVKSIGWAAFLSHDGLAGSLTIWFEEREAWTARSLRAPAFRPEWRRERDFGGLRIL